MSNKSTDFNYSGAKAESIFQSFILNAGEALKAYKAAVADWNSVSDYLAVTGSKEKMDNIVELHTGEIENVIKNVESMKTSLKNVDASWQQVATEINAAIDTYYKKDE